MKKVRNWAVVLAASTIVTYKLGEMTSYIEHRDYAVEQLKSEIRVDKHNYLEKEAIAREIRADKRKLDVSLQNETYVMRSQAANTLNKIISYAGSETVVEDYLLSGAIKSAKRGDYHESRIRLRDVFRRNYAKMNPLQNQEVGIAVGYLENEQALVSSYAPFINNKYINSYKYVKQEEKQQKNMDTEYIEVANQTYVKYNENNATVPGTTFSKPRRINLGNSIQEYGDGIAILAGLATAAIMIYGIIGAIEDTDREEEITAYGWRRIPQESWKSREELEKVWKKIEEEREEKRESEKIDCLYGRCSHTPYQHRQMGIWR